jgi:hypothetical protein
MKPVIANGARGEVIAPFKYSELPKVAADYLREAAGRIRASQRRHILDVGRELAEAKKRLEHGQFGPWLMAEFEMTERTAENYMSAAILVDKSEKFSDLPASTLYLLAAPSTPKTVVDEVNETLRSGKPAPRLKALRSKISDARQAAQRAAEETKLSTRQRKRRAQLKEERERSQREYDQRLAAGEAAAAEIVAILAAKIDADTLEHIEVLVMRLYTRGLPSIIKAAREKAATSSGHAP